MTLCIVGAGIVLAVAAETFSLAWTHTVERIEWREEWRVTGDRLVLETARVKGSGAGMEPPDDAVLEDGFYVWHPHSAPVADLVLRREPHAGDWRLCAGGRCDMLGAWLGRDADPVKVAAAEGEECPPAGR
jgi:hypothetical protein